jgi:hypothetical protein
MDDQRAHPTFRASTPRIDLHEPAELVTGNGHAIPVVIVDTSLEGFRIRSDRVLPSSIRSAKLRVRRYGDFAIELRWSRGKDAGGVFLEPPPKVF